MVRLFLPDAHRFVVAVVTHRGHEAEFVERLDRYIPPRKLLLKKGELKGREGICGHSSVKVSGVKVSGVRFRCEYFVFTVNVHILQYFRYTGTYSCIVSDSR